MKYFTSHPRVPMPRQLIFFSRRQLLTRSSSISHHHCLYFWRQHCFPLRLLVDSFLRIWISLFLRPEFTECVIAKKDISVLDRKNWSNLPKLVLPGSSSYCWRMFLGYFLLSTLMVFSVMFIPNIDETI